MNPKQAHDLVGAPLPGSDNKALPVHDRSWVPDPPAWRPGTHQPVNTAREKQIRQLKNRDQGQGIRGPGTR